MLEQQKYSVMIIDDDEFIQKLLSETLAGEGFRTMVADSAERAIRFLEKKLPDLFVVDILLPGLDGFELCRRLRERAATKYIPILILSSRHTVSDRIKGLQIGADDYLVKPFHLEELVARVQALIRRYQAISPERRPPSVAASLDTDGQAQPVTFEDKKKLALSYFKEKLYEDSLNLWEDLYRENPRDMEVKRYLEIVERSLIRKFMEVLKSKESVPVRTSGKNQDLIGLDLNTEEGFIFSRVDGLTNIKTIVAISGMKPRKAYGILYSLCKSGVIRIK